MELRWEGGVELEAMGAAVVITLVSIREGGCWVFSNPIRRLGRFLEVDR